MTDDTQELDEIERVIRSVLTPNSYIVPEEGVQLTKALLDWHNKQIAKARIDALEYAKISPKFKIEERIERLRLEMRKYE